uniref:Putative Non Disulfide Bridge Peptide n=1 Tax=Megacormus gertschi TaxID=1843536 RepID=A0A224XBS0_9SCOR
MKSQFAFLAFTLVLMQMFIQMEALIIRLPYIHPPPFKSLPKKRYGIGLTKLDDLVEPEISDADLDFLREIFK